jgi:hypothetical protein
LFQLVPSTLPTDATEFGLLPTITTETGRKSDFKQGEKSMFTALNETGMLPTPKATEISETWEQHKNRAKNPNAKNRGASLSATINGMLPTPMSRDYKGGRTKEQLKASGRTETNGLPDAFAQNGKTSQLNPLFVEEMMGFPKNWTALPFQSGEENQSKDTATL